MFNNANDLENGKDIDMYDNVTTTIMDFYNDVVAFTVVVRAAILVAYFIDIVVPLPRSLSFLFPNNNKKG